MIYAAWTIVGVLIGLAGAQAVLVMIYCRHLGRVTGAADRSYQPAAAVILCLRGVDPSLEKVLRGVLSQQYADYELFCVVDHGSDPALSTVNRVADETDRKVRVVIADNPPACKSLKCHGLDSVIRDLDSRFKVIALIDADSIPDEFWLVDLLNPLVDQDVVASTGNRWFLPTDEKIGTLVRYMWHAGASVQMYIYRIPWGGSLALDLNYVKSSGLLDDWNQALFEDTLIARQVRKQGKCLAYVERLLVPNSESIYFSGVVSWLRRQLLNARLYHNKFPLAVIHCFTTSGALAFALLVTLVGLLGARWDVVGISLLGLVMYQLINALMFAGIIKSANRILRLRGVDPGRQKLTAPYLIAFLLTPLVYLVSMLGAMFTTRTRWRGVEYAVKGPFDIEMTSYVPMAELVGESNESMSIEQ